MASGATVIRGFFYVFLYLVRPSSLYVMPNNFDLIFNNSVTRTCITVAILRFVYVFIIHIAYRAKV
jgi:hypothetical protein